MDLTVSKGGDWVKLLVIEDEEGLREALITSLTGEGYQAEGADNGADGLDMILTGLYDLIILDIMLPRMDGFEVLRRVRKEKNHIPIILLTARSALDDKVEGMDMGADDYVTKPFALEELLARIRMVLRRGEHQVENDRFHVGDLIFDTKTYTIQCEGGTRSVRLSAKEYQLLEYLMLNPGRVLSREQITERVWGYDSDAEYNNVDVYVSFLRKKMQYTKTSVTIRLIRGVGYQLEAGEHD